MDYVKLWDVESSLPEWMTGVNIITTLKHSDTSIQQPAMPNVDKYIRDVKVHPYSEGRKVPRARGGYASLGTYTT